MQAHQDFLSRGYPNLCKINLFCSKREKPVFFNSKSCHLSIETCYKMCIIFDHRLTLNWNVGGPLLKLYGNPGILQVPSAQV
jgi:hypothetical protein